MKLNWKIVNENLEATTASGRVFRIAGNLADGFATFLWSKSPEEAGSFVSASNSGIPTLEEAMSLCRRDAEEREKPKRSCDSRLVEERLNELEKRLDDIGTTAAKASTRVGQLWQKHTDELREANKRIGKLEEKVAQPQRSINEARPVGEAAGNLPAKVRELEKRLEKQEAGLDRLDDVVLPEHWKHIAAANDGLHALEHRVTDLEPYGDEPPRFYADQIEKLGDRLAKLEELHSKSPRC